MKSGQEALRSQYLSNHDVQTQLRLDDQRNSFAINNICRESKRLPFKRRPSKQGMGLNSGNQYIFDSSSHSYSLSAVSPQKVPRLSGHAGHGRAAPSIGQIVNRSEQKQKKSGHKGIMSPGTSFMNQETTANEGLSPYQAALISSERHNGQSDAIQLTLRKNTLSRNFPNSAMTMTVQSNMKLKSQQSSFKALGPGAYDVTKEIGKDKPKFSFGRKLSNTRASNIPGPGEYEPRDTISKERVKTPVIKKGERFPQKREVPSPEPGTYHKETDFARNASPITLKGKARGATPQDIPGPGTYDPLLIAVKDAIRTFNIESSQRPKTSQIIVKDQFPGPGEYTSPVRNIGRNSLKYSLYGKLNTVKTNADWVPGPGTYDQQPFKPSSPLPLKLVAPSDHAQRPMSSTLSSLGPGTYEYKNMSIGTEGPKFSLGGKTQKVQKNQQGMPGPGEYEPRETLSRPKSPEILLKGKAKDLLSYMIQMPGPGTYDPLKSIGANALKMSLHGRIESKVSNDIPGPGSYDAALTLVRDRVKSPNLASSLRGTDEQLLRRRASEVPGPGEYDQPSLVGRDAKKITLKGKIENRSGSRSLSPGPGQYDPRITLTKSTTLGFRYTPQAIDSLRKISNAAVSQRNLPGPGEYNPSFRQTRTSLAFTLGGKLNTHRVNDIPGPGTYDAEDHPTRFRNSSPDFSKSREKELVPRPQLETGPGQYDVQNFNDQGILSGHQLISYRFSKGHQRPPVKDNRLPGPGTYDLPDGFGIRKQE